MNKPETDANADFPSFTQAILTVVALFLLEYLALAFVSDVLALREGERADASAIALVLGNAMLFSLLLHYKKLGYRKLFHSAQSSVGATLGLLLVPIVMLVPALELAAMSLNAALVSVFPMSRSQELMFEQMMAGGPLAVIAVCILAPFLEEMLFRGIILRSFLAQYSKRQAIWGSAVVFGAAHMNIYQLALATLMGALLGWLYERTRSLWPCIALHAAYNTAAVLLWHFYGEAQSGYAYDFSLAVWLGAFGIAFAGASLLRRILAVRASEAR